MQVRTPCPYFSVCIYCNVMAIACGYWFNIFKRTDLSKWCSRRSYNIIAKLTLWVINTIREYIAVSCKYKYIIWTWYYIFDFIADCIFYFYRWCHIRSAGNWYTPCIYLTVFIYGKYIVVTCCQSYYVLNRISIFIKNLYRILLTQ